MSQQRNILFLVLGGVILVLLYYISQQNKSYSWQQHFLKNSKDPYGTLYCSEIIEQTQALDSLHILSTAIAESLPLEEQPSNYFFVGEALNFTEEDIEQLFSYVELGNTAFLSCRIIPDELIDRLYPVPCDSIGWYGLSSTTDTIAQMSLVHEDLQPDSNFYFTTYSSRGAAYYQWNFMGHSHICDSLGGFTELGKLNKGLANFVRMSHGDGYFYIHTNPIAFTNLYLLDRKGTTYNQLVLSHLQPGSVYWDEYSRISLGMGQRLNGNNLFDKRLNSKSPLQYILSQPALTWAWYILLAMGLLYLIFRAKRRQRVIPVLEANTNTSLQFISTIGRLYFMQSNHKQLALQKTRLFQVFIKEKYNMNSRDFTDDLATRLAIRSGVANTDIEQIFKMHKNIASGNFVSENTLIDFHKALEKFYHNCK